MNPAPKYSVQHRLEVARWAFSAISWVWLVTLTLLATNPEPHIWVVLLVLSAAYAGMLLWLLKFQRRLIHQIRVNHEKAS